MATFLAKSSLTSFCFIVPHTVPELTLSFCKLTEITFVARPFVLLFACFADDASIQIGFMMPHVAGIIALRFQCLLHGYYSYRSRSSSYSNSSSSGSGSGSGSVRSDLTRSCASAVADI